jgi:hypothetical protein
MRKGTSQHIACLPKLYHGHIIIQNLHLQALVLPAPVLMHDAGCKANKRCMGTERTTCCTHQETM